MAAIRREIDSGQFGSSQLEVKDARDPVDLQGLVGCSRHPVVLLWGLVREPSLIGSLRTGTAGQQLVRVPIPADLHVRADLIYGFLTTGATLEFRFEQ
jgi:hypothetical protein